MVRFLDDWVFQAEDADLDSFLALMIELIADAAESRKGLR